MKYIRFIMRMSVFSVSFFNLKFTLKNNKTKINAGAMFSYVFLNDSLSLPYTTSLTSFLSV